MLFVDGVWTRFLDGVGDSLKHTIKDHTTPTAFEMQQHAFVHVVQNIGTIPRSQWSAWCQDVQDFEDWANRRIPKRNLNRLA